jgi:hypothetical protein
MSRGTYLKLYKIFVTVKACVKWRIGGECGMREKKSKSRVVRNAKIKEKIKFDISRNCSTYI